MRRNPVPPSSAELQIQDAERRYKRFTGMHPELKEWVSLPDFAAVCCIGELDGLLYTTERDSKQESYIHRFKVNARPLLCVTPDGKTIVTLGGAFEFTERGFVDCK